MGWEGLDCDDLRTCSLRSVYGNSRSIKFCQCGKAWASVESGVQHALASYCMLRFQRTSKCLSSSSTYDTMILAECFPPSKMVFNHHQLRAGREGMAKIKSIIHAKLKARRLTSTQFVATKTKMLKLFSIQLLILFSKCQPAHWLDLTANSYVARPVGYWPILGRKRHLGDQKQRRSPFAKSFWNQSLSLSFSIIPRRFETNWLLHFVISF